MTEDPFVAPRPALHRLRRHARLGRRRRRHRAGGWLRWDAIGEDPRATVRDSPWVLAPMMTRKALDRLGSTARRRAKYVGEGSPHPVPTAPDVADDVQPAEIVSIPDAHRSGTLTPTEDPVFVQPAVFDTPTAP